MQKTYQKLQAKNMVAAQAIYTHLKKNKAMSQATFDEIYMKSRGMRFKHGSFAKRIFSTQDFLSDHGLATRQIINGFIVYVATQKTVRTKSFANATIKYQIVTNEDINFAIEYQKINNGMVPGEIEGKVIANILKLEGGLKKQFANKYAEYFRYVNDNDLMGFRKFEIINAIKEIKEIKKV